MSEHSPLHWFPTYVADWLSSPTVSMMLPEQEGAFFRLLCYAWGNGDREPSLPNDAAKLATMSKLGARWRKLGHLIVEQFEERNGRLVNARQVAVWWEQQEKRAVAVRRASAGGKATAEKRRARSGASSTPQASLGLHSGGATNAASDASNIELEAVPPVPNGTGVEQPASSDALAPVGAARAAATSEGLAEFGDAWRAVMQGQSVAPPAPGALETKQAATRERRYFALLASEAAAWMALHRDDAKALDREQRALLNLPEAGDLLLADRRKLRDAVLEEIRERMDWPTTEEWDESDALTHTSLAEGASA